MGTPGDYQPHKLITGILLSRSADLTTICGQLRDLYGPIDFQSDQFDFGFTTYYNQEMGRGITRVLVSFEALVDPSTLADIKHATNRLEADFANPQGGRQVNLDPGLLSLSRIILATTKASAHRVAIGKQMYAELTLLYRHGKYTPFEWTYPDYQSEAYLDWFEPVRQRYHNQLKELEPGRAWRL